VKPGRFAIFGAGGVGGYFAAALARAGYWTGVIARGAQLQAIRERGLHVESPKGDFEATPAAASDKPAEIGPVDAVILTVKAWQVPDVAPQLRPLLGPNTKILPLQNGVEAPEQIAKALGPDHALVGLCRIIAAVVGPGKIRDGGLPPTVSLGEFDGAPLSTPTRLLVEALRDAGMATETPADVQAALWEKLLFIAAVSGTGAVTRSTIGEFRECAESRALMIRLMEEVAGVARARGVALAADVVGNALAFVEKVPAGGTSSMQRDLADGKPSEVEAIIGAVARYGRAAGVPTPATDFVYASLLPQEKRARAARA
jgi:2-dehydropantoate 2-reductase